MIAAHARSKGYTLATDNTKDFIDIDGLKRDDWREAGDIEQLENSSVVYTLLYIICIKSIISLNPRLTK